MLISFNNPDIPIIDSTINELFSLEDDIATLHNDIEHDWDDEAEEHQFHVLQRGHEKDYQS